MPDRDSQPVAVPRVAPRGGNRPGLWLLPAVVAVLVYLPSLRGEFIWNDADYVTKPALTSLGGLWRIWTELGATEQYYPLLHSFFWIQQKLFGYDPLWYHAVNVLLHSTCAALLVLVVRRLFTGRAVTPLTAGSIDDHGGERSDRPTGETIALLAGLIFAVHPVYVESVAWISEQKNTFSLLWYLLAALFYLRWQDAPGRAGRFDGLKAPSLPRGSTSRPGSTDRDRAEAAPQSGSKSDSNDIAADPAGQPYLWWKSSAYWLATFFFVLAILSKSVTATLPCALMVIAWWRHGRLEWRTWVPLVPWVLGGAAMGGVTGWVEHHIIGARGEDFALTLPERGLLAGRVIWFYLGKYAWPTNLIFIYPRWTVDLAVWWQWLFPAAAVGLLAALWGIRGHVRGPLAGYLIFVGSLVPTIGFFNVYAFKFSYVADHWNYLPSLALAVMAAWGAVALGERIAGRAGRFDKLKAPSLPRGSTSRPGSETDIAADPAGQPYLRIAAAAVLVLLAGLSIRQFPGYSNFEIFYQTILRKNPDCWLAAHNLGGLRLDTGRYAEAVPYYEQAVRVRPHLTDALNNLGGVLQRLGRRDEAIARFEQAVRWAPDDADYRRNLGAALASAGRRDEAVVALRAAVGLKPESAELHLLLAQALFEAGRIEEATAERAAFDRLQPPRPAAVPP